MQFVAFALSVINRSFPIYYADLAIHINYSYHLQKKQELANAKRSGVTSNHS